MTLGELKQLVDETWKNNNSDIEIQIYNAAGDMLFDKITLIMFITLKLYSITFCFLYNVYIIHLSVAPILN